MRVVDVALPVKASLGECPRWDEQNQHLYWVDINRGELHCFNPQTGADEFITFEEEVGCFSLRQQGGFVLGMRSGFYLLSAWGGALEFVADPEIGLDKNRFNDGRCDALGRFIAGSVYPPKDHDGANLWSLNKDGSVKKLVDGLLTSNGVAFSPDNKILYYANTPKHAIYASDYDLESGDIANTRLFHQFPLGQGRPDGAAIDEEGHYWTALYEGGRIARLDPLGQIVEEIEIPARCPTMLAFGDADLKTLYVTSTANRPEPELDELPHSGAVFKVRVDVPGLIEHRCAL